MNAVIHTSVWVTGTNAARRLTLALLASVLLHIAFLGNDWASKPTVVSSGSQPGLRVLLKQQSTPQLTHVGTADGPTVPTPVVRGSASDDQRRQVGPVDAESGCGRSFFDSRLVDRAPAPLGQIDRNPEVLRGFSQSGRISAILCIDAEGKVVKVLVEASLLDEPFEHYVIEEFGRLAFLPASIAGRPVAVVQAIDIDFAEPERRAFIEKVPAGADESIPSSIK